MLPDTICQEEWGIVRHIRRRNAPLKFLRKGIEMNTIRRHKAPYDGFFERLQAGLTSGVATVVRLRDARRSRAVTERLLTMDDRMLNDIGVSRGDVEQALTVAWDQSPAVALAEISRRRVQADRQGLMHRRVR